MKITRRQLRQIIRESISEDDTINMSASIPGREDITFDVKIPPVKGNDKTKVDASFTDESGNSNQLSNSSEDQLKLLGALRSALDTAKDDETKKIVSKAIARVTGSPEGDEFLVKLVSQAKTDRKLAAASQHVQDPKTNLTA